MKPFAGLTTEFFAAYSQEKWASNVHNLARMRVKDALVGLGERVEQRSAAELAGLERGASDEMPNLANHKKVDAQWIFWFRDAAARAALAGFLERMKLDATALLNIAPQDKHAAIALTLRHEELFVGLHVASGASLDRRNMAAKLQKGWERERLLELMRALPSAAHVGFGNEQAVVTAANVGDLEEQAAAIDHNEAAWQLGYTLPREEAIAAGEALVERLALLVQAIAPVYRFIAWTRDNDHVEAQKQLQEEKKEKRRQATAYNAGDKVRIMSGLFSGKIGVVQDTDTKAQVKVRVGKMSVVISGTEIVPA